MAKTKIQNKLLNLHRNQIYIQGNGTIFTGYFHYFVGSTVDYFSVSNLRGNGNLFTKNE